MVRSIPPEFIWQLFRYDANVYGKCRSCGRKTHVDWWKFEKVMAERIANIEPRMRCIECGQMGASLYAPRVNW
jgi:hypothetical protein